MEDAYGGEAGYAERMPLPQLRATLETLDEILWEGEHPLTVEELQALEGAGDVRRALPGV